MPVIARESSMVDESPHDDGDTIGRRTPAKGVLLSSDMPLILFCTVCADDRGKWVAQSDVMNVLQEIWRDVATAWLVGDYVLMPDHLHFICSPQQISDGVSVERWTGFWKDRFAKKINQPQWRWQDGLFHTRMRSDAHYQEKLAYMRENPVRAGLVATPEVWPWRGCVHDLSAPIRSFGRPLPKRDPSSGEHPNTE